MMSNLLRIEFFDRNMTKKILQGNCFSKKSRLQLELGSSIVGCTPTTQRAIGVPLNLWFNHKIEEKCGGWIATEEEIEQKNHLKWARILITEDVRNIPFEVVIF